MDTGTRSAHSKEVKGIGEQLARDVRLRYVARFGSTPAPRVALAPGRVNLIGEHVDYNDGVVLPMAIDRHVAVAVAPRADERISAESVHHREMRDIEASAASSGRSADWTAYVAAVVSAFRERGVRVPGLNVVIQNDLPIGSGLSSSAALEVALACAIASLANVELAPLELARLAQHAENDFVGVQCGLMDQAAVSAAAEGCALLFDCRTLEMSRVPIPHGARVVVMDTGVRRSLAATAYNDRREECRRAVDAIRALAPRIRALRDVDDALLSRAEATLDAVAYRRARHVVAEIERPAAMAAALRAGALAEAGRLMNESHASLRDLYEVSCRELDVICEIARAQRGCFGARMTGAGFGGCAVALVATAVAEPFVTGVGDAYRRETGQDGGVFSTNAARGVRLVGDAEAAR